MSTNGCDLMGFEATCYKIAVQITKMLYMLELMVQ